MSENERNKGKLIPVDKSIDEIFDEIGGNDEDTEFWSKEEYVKEFGIDHGYETINEELYKVEWEVNRDTDCFEFADVDVDDSGVIYFHTYHYNGGGHWTELVEEKLNEG